MRPRLILAFVGALIVAGLAAALAEHEIRDTLWLDLSPKSFRDAELQRFDGPGGERLEAAIAARQALLETISAAGER